MGILSNILGNAGVVDSAKLTDGYGALLIGNESIEVGFNIFRDKIYLYKQKANYSGRPRHYWKQNRVLDGSLF